MRIFPAVLILVILHSILFLPAAMVAAAGGGGGGGSGGGSGSSGGGSSSSGGSGPHLTDFKCFDTGQVVFDQKPIIDPVVLRKGDGTDIAVKGDWSGTWFSSEEAEIGEPGSYVLADPINGNKTVACPGLRFSCKLVKITLLGCTIDDSGLSAAFKLEGPGVSVDNVTLQFSQQGSANVFRWEKGSFSSAVKSLSIAKKGDGAYDVSVQAPLKVSKLQASYKDCIGRYYAYSRIDCVGGKPKSAAAEQPVATPGKELKCGGYLDIADRVKCRLQLREEEKDEYENFFPEECKARDDKEKCLGVYRAVQECWSFPNGPSRIGCVKKALNLGELTSEIAKCSGTAADQKQTCNTELRDKVYSLVKFRLYNLEEEAEEMMEDGLLTKEDVAAFVVKMEQSKLAFNTAATNKERKDIILQARQAWNELLAKRKAK